MRREGEWEAWLDFFLEGVEYTAKNAVVTAQRLVALFDEDARKIRTSGRRASSAARVLDVLCKRPIITLNEVSRRTGLSFPAAAKGMQTLLSLGVAREMTGKKRNRIFAYDRYLDILSEGTEPL